MSTKASHRKKTKNFGPLAAFYAAANGEVDNLREIIKAGFYVKSVDAQGCTALHIAAHSRYVDQNEDRGQAACAQLLIDMGALIEAVDSINNTPLIVAAATGRLSVLDVLIRNNAELNTKGKFGFTALHAAARYDFIKSVQRLLDAGSDASILNDEKELAEGIAKTEEIRSLIREYRLSNAIDDLRDSIPDFPPMPRHTP